MGAELSNCGFTIWGWRPSRAHLLVPQLSGTDRGCGDLQAHDEKRAVCAGLDGARRGHSKALTDRARTGGRTRRTLGISRAAEEAPPRSRSGCQFREERPQAKSLKINELKTSALSVVGANLAAKTRPRALVTSLTKTLDLHPLRPRRLQASERTLSPVRNRGRPPVDLSTAVLNLILRRLFAEPPDTSAVFGLETQWTSSPSAKT